MRNVSDSPLLMSEWDWKCNSHLNPDHLPQGSSIKAYWLCSLGHSYESSVNNKSNRHSGCPYCVNRKVLAGFNDLKSQFPQIAAELIMDMDTPDTSSILATSSQVFTWRCVLGHVWEAKVKYRTTRNQGCPYCANRKVLSGFNDLASRNPELVPEWSVKNLESPCEVLYTSSKKVWWKCVNNHEWGASVIKRSQRRQGCPYCANRKVWSGFNDLATVNPQLTQEWHPSKNGLVTPSEVLYGTANKYWWQCFRGHSWEASVAHRQSTGCPYCSNSNTRVLAGFNDLKTVSPILACEWDEVLNGNGPEMVTVQSSQKVWWRCQKGHSWKAAVYSRRHSGCPQCGSNASASELEIAKFVEGLVGSESVVRHDRSLIAPYELDVYIPSKHLAIEVNGVYWHQENVMREAGRPNPRQYHYNKWKQCRDKQVQLLQVWEDDWCYHSSIIKSMIQHKLGLSISRVMARKTVGMIPDKNVVREFLNSYHIQGFKNFTRSFGLVDETGSLVAVMSFSLQNGTAVLDRFATSVSVPGGFSKLLKYAVAQLSGVHRIVSFSDHEVSDGTVYVSNGFTLDRELPPDYKYVWKNCRYHKFLFRKQRFMKDSELLWQDGLTESELAELNGLSKVWDSGKTRWVKMLDS
jgi:hypothetical protein